MRNILDEINKVLFSFTGSNHLRIDDGTLLTKDSGKFTGLKNHILRAGVLDSLFPALAHSNTESFYKNEKYESAKDKETPRWKPPNPLRNQIP